MLKLRYRNKLTITYLKKHHLDIWESEAEPNPRTRLTMDGAQVKSYLPKQRATHRRQTLFSTDHIPKSTGHNGAQTPVGCPPAIWQDPTSPEPATLHRPENETCFSQFQAACWLCFMCSQGKSIYLLKCYFAHTCASFTGALDVFKPTCILHPIAVPKTSPLHGCGQATINRRGFTKIMTTPT